MFLLCLVTFSYAQNHSINEIAFIDDNASSRAATLLHPDSHIKVFLPNIPYTYIAKCTNSGLIRSFDNEQGWIYDLAQSHTRHDDFTYEFELKKDLKFQDGTDFNTDSVIQNFDYFKKSPILHTNIDKVDFDVIKIDNYRFKIILKQKYEMFFFDLESIYFYSKKYLEKYGFSGEETGSAIQAPGSYGMGPYILSKGVALGMKQTSELELLANPHYWNEEYPKIKKVTVYTQLNTHDAFEMATLEEGKLDIMPIPFNKKIEVLQSKYAKLLISQSTNNFILFFNLINGHEKLQDRDVRIALNQALSQENLLNFVYKNEGVISPFASSINYKVVKQVAQKDINTQEKFSKEKIKELLNGLHLNIFTQDQFMFLCKGIEYQLLEYGVSLHYSVTNSEKDIYNQLLTTHISKNSKNWDVLVWGDDDWFYANPWSVFFIYQNGSAWSTIGRDDIMSGYIDTFFETKIDTQAYESVVAKILYRARDMAYTLRVPSPNKVLAVNKEVIYKPYKGAILPLWEIQITENHWSIRGDKPYPQEFQNPYKPQRINHENNQ